MVSSKKKSGRRRERHHRDKEGVHWNRRSIGEKKEDEGGALGRQHTTKVWVSRIISRHTVQERTTFAETDKRNQYSLTTNGKKEKRKTLKPCRNYRPRLQKSLNACVFWAIQWKLWTLFLFLEMKKRRTFSLKKNSNQKVMFQQRFDTDERQPKKCCTLATPKHISSMSENTHRLLAITWHAF